MAYLSTNQKLQTDLKVTHSDQSDFFIYESNQNELLQIMKNYPLNVDWLILNTLSIDGLFFDFDGTIILEETIDQMAHKCDVKDQIASITKKAMEGEIDFNTSFKQRVQLLEALSKKDLSEIVLSLTLRDEFKELLELAKRMKIPCFVISGGFEWIIQELLKDYDITDICSNTIVFDEKDLWIQEKSFDYIVNAEAKSEFVKKTALKYKFDLDSCIAFGDGANDINMMQNIGHRVGLCPKKILLPYLTGVSQSGSFKHMRRSIEWLYKNYPLPNS